MRFEVIEKETVFCNPQKGMARKVIPTQIRKDPLTGRTSRVCHLMRLQWAKPDFHALVAGTEQTCPFCPQRVLTATPCFPEEIVPQGRLRTQDMVLFPNIAPYDGLGAVLTLGDEHFVPMTGFTPRRLAAAFGLALDFFRLVEERKHPESVYHLVNWNYMPVSGSSVIHPHLQVFATSSAPNLLREELEAARRYNEVEGTDYWDDLVAHEKLEGRRFLGTIGRTHWVSAFAPLGAVGDTLAVVEGVRTTLELTREDCTHLAEGLTRVMGVWDASGIHSFNMTFFTAAAHEDHARFHLLFSPRTYFNQAVGTPDVGALRLLYNEPICMAFPEEIAAMLRKAF